MWKYSQTGQFKLVPRRVVTRSFVTMSPCLILPRNLPVSRKSEFHAATFEGVNEPPSMGRRKEVIPFFVLSRRFFSPTSLDDGLGGPLDEVEVN